MIEQLARASAEELRAGTTSDVEAGLADLHVRHVRHQRRTRLGLVVAAVLAVGLGGIGGAVLTHRDDRGIPPTHPAPSRNRVEDSCPTLWPVQCLGHDTYRIAMWRPVEWRIPARFSLRSKEVWPWQVTGNSDDGQAGVTVMESVRASSPNGDGPAADVADSPQAFVHWVASRPFLSAGPVRTTTIDGHRAWQVRATLAPHVPPRPATCNQPECHEITYQPAGLSTGVSDHQASEYTAFRLPGVGTTVVWSWSFQPYTHVGTLEKVIQGLSWPTH